jgi:hypothetical protein
VRRIGFGTERVRRGGDMWPMVRRGGGVRGGLHEGLGQRWVWKGNVCNAAHWGAHAPRSQKSFKILVRYNMCAPGDPLQRPRSNEWNDEVGAGGGAVAQPEVRARAERPIGEG